MSGVVRSSGHTGVKSVDNDLVGDEQRRSSVGNGIYGVGNPSLRADRVASHGELPERSSLEAGQGVVRQRGGKFRCVDEAEIIFSYNSDVSETKLWELISVGVIFCVPGALCRRVAVKIGKGKVGATCCMNVLQ